jgi:hypothetical protein
MSAPGGCPELEVLFTELAQGAGVALEHARTCAACSALLEEHRQLERDLFRLADPRPPAVLVSGVMARVAAAPVPVWRELWTGLSILATSLVLGLLLFVSSDASLGWAGTAFVSVLDGGLALVGGLLSALRALWLTAAAPLAVMVGAFLVASLLALRRVVSAAVPSSKLSGA